MKNQKHAKEHQSQRRPPQAEHLPPKNRPKPTHDAPSPAPLRCRSPQIFSQEDRKIGRREFGGSRCRPQDCQAVSHLAWLLARLARLAGAKRANNKNLAWFRPSDLPISL